MVVETRVRVGRFLSFPLSLISACLLDATWNWGSAKPRAWGKKGEERNAETKEDIVSGSHIQIPRVLCSTCTGCRQFLVSDLSREPAAGDKRMRGRFFVVQQL